MTIADYLDPSSCPEARPPFDCFSSETRSLHEAIDRASRERGMPFLHPEDPTIQLDMLGSRHMTDWQERKVEWMMTGERCWSDLHQFYARYGVETTRRLLVEVRKLERAAGAVLTDCGMQAVALTFDLLARPDSHAILARAVYNKSRRYLEWLGNRHGIEVTLVDDGDYDALEAAVRKDTSLVFVETYTNPLMRAVDPERLGAIASRARQESAHGLRLVVDNTIATPWGPKRALLDFEGIDVVLASGTKALAGQDRDLWGYVASNRVDFLNELMDLEAMRGGGLDWRRAGAILEGLPLARERFAARSATAARVAEFLASHEKVESVHHPSRPEHPDSDVIAKYYVIPGSLLSLRLGGADEDRARHFADVLAMTTVFRYAGSFDGLTSKVNHHRTVSEYFTPEEELERSGIDRLIRLGVGVEPAEDLVAALNWALWHFEDVSPEKVLDWQHERERVLGISADR